MRRRADSNRRIGVLQTPALTTWPRRQYHSVERKKGFEPSTFSLARRRSTTELLPLVPRRRFELLRAFAHHPLKMACLPIPPPRHLAGVGGLEPPTCGFGDRCSSQLSYTPFSTLPAAFIKSKVYYICRAEYS